MIKNLQDYSEEFQAGYEAGRIDGYDEGWAECEWQNDYESAVNDAWSEGYDYAITTTPDAEAIVSVIRETQERFLKMKNREPYDDELAEAIRRSRV